MKRLSLLLLALLLGGCLIITDDPEPTPDPLEVISATYETNAAVDGQPIICDDRTTEITYRFRYQGELESWTSYLKGVTLGQIKGEETFRPGAEGVSPYETNGYEVTYTLGPNVAPYASGEASKAIIVVPDPTVIGHTILHLRLEGTNGESASYFTAPIPVVQDCP
jgi:hypothetical protein